MFISGGENVYPAEIEAVVASLAGVKEAAVVGVPDEKWGEVGYLYLAIKDGAAVSREEVFSFLNERLAKYKIPKHLSFIDALPRNGAGKALKTALREMTGRQSAS
jgi:fatty-acyl-CoA synthase